MPIKVFIVDDHYMVIEGIRSLLQNEKEIEWVGHATNATSCMAYLEKQLPDIILMDINLPDISGIELCKEVLKLYPQVYVIGLSTFNQQSFIQKMIDSGASGYLLKNATKDELVGAMQIVVKGRQYLSHEVSLSLRSIGNNQVVLTRREKEVLELIAAGMTNNEIAVQLFISVTTVDTHRKNLLTKFEARNIAALIKKAVSSGTI